ncbi:MULTISPECIES: hypothetical protein [unclassified Streptomyces]|uniref:hypothetical protein n=1 Tax=unclassified Streptomyces TaxID=2593676 RepID=UPI00081D90C4|nr:MULTISPECIES: hypothetical protein [unclassified Streptomyces]MYZ36004.1 hypothetical protein [Streptomyces sp. SID4917]SCF80168.1 hypothetical protein GA0115259_1028014 [Streptomyces sp. MnatMP-M17]
MSDHWDTPSPQETEQYRRALLRAATQLREAQSQCAEDGASPALMEQILGNLDAYGADALFDVLGVLLDQITEHAPDSVRDADGIPVLDGIRRHRYIPDEMKAAVLADNRRRGMPVPPAADLQAYLARAARTGDLTQQLLTLRHAHQAGAGSIEYTLLLMALGPDELQLRDILNYLLAVSRRLEWTAS